MALAFSRNLEEIIATRVLLTATDGFIDITALGRDGEGGVVSVNGRSLRLASENSFLTLESCRAGNGQIALRAAGAEGSIVLTTPTAGRTALVSVCPGGLQLVRRASQPGHCAAAGRIDGAGAGPGRRACHPDR